MDERRRQIAAELLADAQRHDASREDRLERFRCLEADSAQLLWILARAAGATELLELGTSIGHSTLWLADAAAANGGTLLSLDIDAGRSAAAASHLERAGLVAELRVADAGEVLAAAGDAGWDLVFLDAERPDYPGYWPDLLRTLRRGGLLVVDNVLSHADQLTEFTALVEGEPGVISSVVETGAGMRLILRDSSVRRPGWRWSAGAAGRSPRR
ncbi:MAG TPA: class I SAM-dependent methyltransferase [Solirubrobacterales bacterium]|jgi:predicted O-methyltransferase YrrM|nr:class I SAM-dependent methyltransferase [Solirubrobacterales bacterium]